MFMLKELRKASNVAPEHVPAADVEVFDQDNTPEINAASQSLIEGLQPSGEGVQMLPTIGVEILSRFIDVRTIYKTNPWLYAVVNLKARSYSRMPPKIYETAADGYDERSTSGRGLQLEKALRRPGKGLSGTALRLGTARDRLTRGNALHRLHLAPFGAITGIERIPWSVVRVSEVAGEILYTDTRHHAGDWRHHSYTAGEVIHYGLYEDEGVAADSPIMALRSTLALFEAVYTHILAYFARGARPSGHFKVDPAADPGEVAKVAAMIEEYMVGPTNSGRVLISSAEWASMTDSPDHSKIIELAKQSREEICGTYGVSPPLVGILDRAIMSNVRELREHTTRDTVGPDVELFDDTFSAQLEYHHPYYDGLWLESEIGATLKADIEGQAKTIPNQLRVQTPNELRRRANLRPLDDPEADKIWTPNSGSDSSGSEGGESSASSFTKPSEDPS